MFRILFFLCALKYHHITAGSGFGLHLNADWKIAGNAKTRLKIYQTSLSL